MAPSPKGRPPLQVSCIHGFIKYDCLDPQVLRVSRLPDHNPQMPRELILLDFAHHGIAMDHAGQHLCAAGTMSDYAAIVDRDDFTDHTLILKEEDAKPY